MRILTDSDPAVRSFREQPQPGFHPFRRLFARMFDHALAGLLVNFLIISVFRVRPVPAGWLASLVNYGLWWALIPIQALLTAKLGTTPGKWFMGIRVEYPRGGRLSFEEALEREKEAFRQGMGYGIPVWELIRMYRSYTDYMETGETYYDQGTVMTFTKWNGKRLAYMAAALAVYAVLWTGVTLDAVLPKYRHGDLTVSQFSEVYNDYLFTISRDATGLDTEGKTRHDPENFVTYLDGPPAEFHYETGEDGGLRAVIYENEWDRDSFFLDLPPIRCTCAAMAVVGSQPEVKVLEYLRFCKAYNEAVLTMKPEMELFCGNVRIAWKLESDGFLMSGGSAFPDPEAEDGYVRLRFVIEVS